MPKAPKDLELVVGRRRDFLDIRADREIPAGCRAGLLDRGIRLEPGHHELSRFRIGLVDADVGDDGLGPATRESVGFALPTPGLPPQPSARATAVTPERP
jgi:hypothetical protein